MSDKSKLSREVKDGYMKKFESNSYSFKGMSNYDIFCILLVLVIRDGTRIDELAKRFDEDFDTVGGMLYSDEEDLKKYNLSDSECYKIKMISAVMDFIHFDNYKRLSKKKRADTSNIKSHICQIMKYKLYEHMYLFLADDNKCIKEVRPLSKGTGTKVVLEYRKLEKYFKIFPEYRYFIIAHNHADHSEPSFIDASSTSVVYRYGEKMGRTLLASYVVRGGKVSEVENASSGRE